MDTLNIQVKVLEVNQGEFEGNKYEIVTGRALVDDKDRLVKFRVDLKKGFSLHEQLDKDVVLELAFVCDFKGNASLKVVGFR